MLRKGYSCVSTGLKVCVFRCVHMQKTTNAYIERGYHVSDIHRVTSLRHLCY